MAADLELLRTILLFAAPLLVAAIGELVAERAGIVNIGIEGMMLAGALGAWLANVHLGIAAGIAGGIVAAMILGLLFAAVILVFAADQIVAGAGLNLLALGLTGLVHRRLETAFGELPVHILSPWWLVIAAGLLAMGVWTFFALTRAGLELSAIGEAPQAADTAGVNVARRRLYAILFAAGCAGLGGAYLSTMRFGGFAENMTAGDGFLALALVIFGRWHPAGIVLAALFFGLVRAYANRFIVQGIAGESLAPLFNLLPYAVSLAALAGLAGRSRAPAALGRAYVRAG